MDVLNALAGAVIMNCGREELSLTRIGYRTELPRTDARLPQPHILKLPKVDVRSLPVIERARVAKALLRAGYTAREVGHILSLDARLILSWGSRSLETIGARAPKPVSRVQQEHEDDLRALAFIRANAFRYCHIPRESNC